MYTYTQMRSDNAVHTLINIDLSEDKSRKNIYIYTLYSNVRDCTIIGQTKRSRSVKKK